MAAKKKNIKSGDLLTASVNELVVNMAALQNEHRELMGHIQSEVVEAVEAIKQLDELKKTKEEELKSLHGEQISDLRMRLDSAEKARDDAQARAAAIATSALNKDAGAQALQELRQVAHKQAESKK